MSFKDFQFDPAITVGIAACGFAAPTPIQQQSIQPILDGNDLLGLAQTGTGKTAAFVLPMLQRLLQGPRKRTRGLILAPTRELAQQIHDNITIMAQKTGLRSAVIYGGVSKQPQLLAFSTGVEILVACPGRLLDLLQEKAGALTAVEFLVLDEADHMFDKGFLPDLRRIIKVLPQKRQSVIFSATMPEEIDRLTHEVLRDPVRVKVNHLKPAASINHSMFQVEKSEKTKLLTTLLKDGSMPKTLVFTRTKHKAKSLAAVLQKQGFDAISMQGNLSQQKRQIALDGFRNGRFSIMIATDIAARGIDVDEISHVVNYDMPDTAETFTHRTGRTGRAEHSGQAITFVAAEDMKMVRAIEKKTGLQIPTIRQLEKDTACGNNQATSVAGRISPELKGKAASMENARAGVQHKRKNRSRSFDFGLR